MSNKPSEILLFEYLDGAVAAIDDEDAVLFGVAVQDTVYQSMVKIDRLVRVSDAEGGLSPGPGGQLGEFDVKITLVVGSRVKGSDKTERATAVTDLFLMQRAVCQLLFDDETLGSRVCEVLVKDGVRGYDILDGEPYAVANIPLIVNPTGAAVR